MKPFLIPCLPVFPLLASSALAAPPLAPPPGASTTSWVGNSFGGGGGPNGFGSWIQDGADEIEVAPDGTVFAGVDWDESGRCLGLYREGRTNTTLWQTQGGGLPDSAWGWGTGNHALAISGDQVYVANTGKRLLRFAWMPGDLNSGRFLGAVSLTDDPVGLTANAETVAVVSKNAIEFRRARDLTVTGRVDLPDAEDAAFAPDGTLWVIAGGQVRHLAADGRALGQTVPGLQRPSAISIDPQGRLIVCDNGPRQQVLCYDVTGAPRLVKTFGREGGLLAGSPGALAPDKFFALRGAGADAAGNLYVGMSFGNGPNGNFFLRAFRPDGGLRWSVYSAAFVATYGFDPASDGRTLVSRTTITDLDLSRTQPGSEARPRAVTLDPLHFPNDDRLKYGTTAMLRRLNGRRVLYTIGQYAGGYRIYTFGPGDIAHEVDHVGGPEQWAWGLDAAGGIWHGDGPNKTVLYYPYGGWTKSDQPRYDWDHPRTFPWPDGWGLVRRVFYDAKTDSLYLTGYLAGQAVETWGVVGATARRYDGWLSGKRILRWSVDLPRDGNSGKEGPLTPECMDIAGDFFFCGMVMPTQGRQRVHVLRVSDGRMIGTFTPSGEAVGDQQGWIDMPYGLQAFRRKNGEYLILVEEDARAKNLLYRWRPDDPGTRAGR